MMNFMTTMKRFGLLGAFLMYSLAGSQAASSIFINTGSLTNVPQVDAITFVNEGLFNIGTILPYETVNTLYYTNTGRMIGVPGFRFENVTPGVTRRPAASFFNGVDASIFGSSGDRPLPGVAVTNAGLTFESGQVLISATNIFSRGQFLADASGRIRLDGQVIDLSRSAVGIFPFVGGLGSATPTNFIPDVGIFDLYWAASNEGSASFDSGGLARRARNSTNFMVATPQHVVTNLFSPNGFATSLVLTNAYAFVVTNAVTPTNWVVQAVFVQTQDPKFSVDVRFAPSSISTNPFTTPVVEFTNFETNVLQGGEFITQVYLIDRLAAETNFGLATNLLTLNTYRPANYEVTRATPPEFLLGSPADPAASTNANMHLYNRTFTNTIVTNVFTAYGFNVTNVSFTPPNVPGVSLTNMPGRVEIQAGDLNLNRTRIRAEGVVTIKANNVTSTNAVVDSQNVALNVGSTSGNLQVKGLVKDTVARTTGNVFAWSASWTNQTGFVTTNAPADPMGTPEVVTNTVDVGFHVLVVDADIITQVPVQTVEFTARSGNLSISDTLRLVESAKVDATNLVLTTTGKLLFGQKVTDWNAQTFPNLVNVVNDGLISIPRNAFYGSDRESGYGSFINRGSNTAFNASIRARLFENSGQLIVNSTTNPPGVGTIFVEAGTANLTGGLLRAGGEIRLAVNDLVMQGSTSSTLQAFVLSVTNSIVDGGRADGNRIRSEGFHLLRRARSGDLLGTTFESVAPIFLEVPHTSAAEDRGASPEGFSNNLAVGHVILDGKPESLFLFRGMGRKNALYIDLLELKGSVTTDVANSIRVEPNLVIYFADSIGVRPEQLNGLFADADAPQGRLRWVPSFVGPNSATDVLMQNNQLVLMNRGLRSSSTIDTDGDGIVNDADPYPLEADPASRVTVNTVLYNKDSSVIAFSWDAQPGRAYVVEFTTDLNSQNWQLLARHTNTTRSVSPAVVQDQIPAGTPQRFYRIRPVSR